MAEEMEEAILDRRIGEALELADALIQYAQAYSCTQYMNNIQDIYRQMLYYYRQGTPDPERHTQYAGVQHRLFVLLRRIRHQFRVDQKSDTYATWALKQKSENPIQRIGRELWLTPILKQGEIELYTDLMFECIPTQQRWVAGCVMLGLWEMFDATRLRMLVHIAMHPKADLELRTRAVTFTVLACLRYERHINILPDLKALVDELLLHDDVREMLVHIQQQLLVGSKADQTTEEVQNHLMPRIMDNLKRNRKLQMGFDEEDENHDGINKLIHEQDLTPEEKKINKELGGDLHKMLDMFSMGMDVNFNSYSSGYREAFFEDPTNWLLPFDKSHPLVKKMPIGMRLLTDILMTMSQHCDTDKYALCCMAYHSRQAQVFINAETPEMQAEGLGLLKGISEKKKHEQQNSKDIIRNVMQCLNRLFNYPAWKGTWVSPFTDQMMLIHTNSIISEHFSLQAQYQVVPTMLGTGYHQLALPILNQLYQERHDYESLSKMGTCHEELHDYESAIRCWKMMDEAHPYPENEELTWLLLKRMQQCYEALDDNAQRAECLRRMLQMREDDTKTMVDLGMCLIRMEQYDEAIKYFYQLEFSNRRVVPASRAIAWCLLQTGQYERASRYYARLLKNSQTARDEDYLNAGHCAFLMGLRHEAQDLYMQHATHHAMHDPEARDILQHFTEDEKLLHDKGLDYTDIALMRDAIRMGIRENAEKH